MRHRNETKSMRVVFRFVVGIMMSLFILGLTNAQNVEGFTQHKGRFWKHKPVKCGDVLEDGNFELRKSLSCDVSPAIAIVGPVQLDLKGHTVSGTDGAGVCIHVSGNGATVLNGTVENCEDGIYITAEGEQNTIKGVTSSNNSRRGFNIFGSENLLSNCLATDNGRQGFIINGGTGNKIFSCKIARNGRDGIEIRGGAANNRVSFNRVEDNGSGPSPWSYAGIDVQSGSVNNKIKYNNACGNLGCDGSGDFPCTARERDFWDENVDDEGNSVSTNVWRNNRVVCKNVEPEFSPEPED